VSKGRVYRPTLIDLSREEKKHPQGANSEGKTAMANCQNRSKNVGAWNVSSAIKTVEKDTNTAKKAYNKSSRQHIVKMRPSRSIHKKRRQCSAHLSGVMSSKVSMIISTIKKRKIWPVGYSMDLYFGDVLRIFLSSFKEGELNAIAWMSRECSGQRSIFSYSRRITEKTFSSVLRELKANISAAIERLLKNILPDSMIDMYMKALWRARAKDITPEIYVEVVLFVPPEHTLKIDVKEKVFLRLNEEEHVIDDIILAEKYRALCVDLIGAIINRSSEVITKELTIILVEFFKDLFWHYNMRYYAASIMGISAL